jgi:hypothetical protein
MALSTSSISSVAGFFDFLFPFLPDGGAGDAVPGVSAVSFTPLLTGFFFLFFFFFVV